MATVILKNTLIVTGASSLKGALVVKDAFIHAIVPEETDCRPEDSYPGAEVFDLRGLTTLAGVVDAHVHFREPGLTHKGDIASESAAALLGGVTSFIDMPNTTPPTVSAKALQEKIAMARGRSYSNFGFHIGASNSNFEEIAGLCSKAERHFAGVKVFMGSSTGNMLVDRGDVLDKLFSLKDIEVLVHSEDEAAIKAALAAEKEKYGDNIPFSAHPFIRSRRACILSTSRALELAIKHGTRLHLLHISTKEEAEMVRAAKLHNPHITAETSANYLWFSDEDYETMGAGLKCNPAVKTAEDRAALREAVKNGIIDTIGSDHAPHLAEEKSRPYISCPSGLPTIGYSLEAMLTIAAQEGISLSRLTSLMSEKPAEIFGLERRGRVAVGYRADLVVVDPGREHIATTAAAGKSAWTPYEGKKMCGKIEMVFLGGRLAVESGRIVGEARGEELTF